MERVELATNGFLSLVLAFRLGRGHGPRRVQLKLDILASFKAGRGGWLHTFVVELTGEKKKRKKERREAVQTRGAKSTSWQGGLPRAPGMRAPSWEKKLKWWRQWRKKSCTNEGKREIYVQTRKVTKKSAHMTLRILERSARLTKPRVSLLHDVFVRGSWQVTTHHAVPSLTSSTVPNACGPQAGRDPS